MPGLLGAQHAAAPRISRSFIATAMPAPSRCSARWWPAGRGGLGERNLRAGTEVGVTAFTAAGRRGPQLVQLRRKPEGVGALDDQVLALEMSSPVSTIVAHQDVEPAVPESLDGAFQHFSSGICPCATTTRASGHQRARPGGVVDRRTRLWMGNACPRSKFRPQRRRDLFVVVRST